MTAMNKLTKRFEAELVEEYSCLPKAISLGRCMHEMTLVPHDPDLGSHIVWDYVRDGEEDQTLIGLELRGKKVEGYDGVFELPKEAIALLEENGYDCSEVK